MTKILTVCAAALSIVLIAGCQSSYVNQPSSPLEVIAKAEVTPNIDVGEKIEATATVYRILGLFISGPGKFAEGVNYGSNLTETPVSSSSFWGDTICQAKAAAAYRACTENKADFILCPRYYVITNNHLFWKSTTAKVFGYKGTLNGIENKVAAPPVGTVQSVQLSGPIHIAGPIKIVQEPAPKAVQPESTTPKTLLPLDSSSK